jgi:hypothetical protein
MTLATAFISLFVGLLVIPPILYYGVRCITPAEQVSIKKAVVVAFLGIILTGGLESLVGWLPVVGVLVAPLAWIGVVRGFYSTSWPIAAALGMSSWALPVLMVRFLGGL